MNDTAVDSAASVTVGSRAGFRAGFVVGAFLLVGWVVVAVFWPQLAPADPMAQHPSQRMLGPGGGHLFGTDQFGRDVLSRVMAGARPVLEVAPLATALGVAVGSLLGLVCGARRGLFDEIVMRVVDVLAVFPNLVAAVVVVVALVGRSTTTLVLVIGTFFVPIVTRSVRAAVLVEREKPYVEAVRLRGEPFWSLLWREVLPNVTGTVLVEAGRRGLRRLDPVLSRTRPATGIPGVGGLRGRQPGLPPAGLVDGAVPGARRRKSRHQCRADRRQPAGTGRAVVGDGVVGDGVVGDAVVGEAVAAGGLVVEGLTVSYPSSGGPAVAVDGVSLRVRPGETYGLVGESGCGKSTLAAALAGVLPGGGAIDAGRIVLDGVDVRALSAREHRRWRADAFAMVHQGTSSSLDPTVRVGAQVAEACRLGGAVPGRGPGAGRRAARRGAAARARDDRATLAARTLRGPAAAGRHRRGPRRQPPPARPRRADHRP